MIKHVGDKWVLFTSDGSRRLGTHSSHADAAAQEAAIKANEAAVSKVNSNHDERGRFAVAQSAYKEALNQGATHEEAVGEARDAVTSAGGSEGEAGRHAAKLDAAAYPALMHSGIEADGHLEDGAEIGKGLFVKTDAAETGGSFNAQSADIVDVSGKVVAKLSWVSGTNHAYVSHPTEKDSYGNIKSATGSTPLKALASYKRIWGAKILKSLIEKLGDDSKGMMVCLPLAADVASQLACDCAGALAPDDLHITLVYLGKGDLDLDTVVEAIQSIDQGPLEGTVGSLGFFDPTPNSDNQAVYWAGVQVPGLKAFRKKLVSALAEQGIEAANDFEYQPHITLTYGTEPDEPPTLPVSFDRVCVVTGSDVTEVSLVEKDLPSGSDVHVPSTDWRRVRKDDDDFSWEVPIAKLDFNDDKRLVFGWMSVVEDEQGLTIGDLQGDTITSADLEDGVYDYVLTAREMGDSHKIVKGIGKLVESMVFTREKQQALNIPAGCVPVGWWVGYYVENDDTWQKIKDGTYRMFSIGGKGVREKLAKANSAQHAQTGKFVTRGGAYQVKSNHPLQELLSSDEELGDLIPPSISHGAASQDEDAAREIDAHGDVAPEKAENPVVNPSGSTYGGNGNFELPKNHRPLMAVPEGGSSCAKCVYFDGDQSCMNQLFVTWQGRAELPGDPALLCSDWFEPKGDVNA